MILLGNLVFVLKFSKCFFFFFDKKNFPSVIMEFYKLCYFCQDQDHTPFETLLLLLSSNIDCAQFLWQRWHWRYIGLDPVQMNWLKKLFSCFFLQTLIAHNFSGKGGTGIGLDPVQMNWLKKTFKAFKTS